MIKLRFDGMTISVYSMVEFPQLGPSAHSIGAHGGPMDELHCGEDIGLIKVKYIYYNLLLIFNIK